MPVFDLHYPVYAAVCPDIEFTKLSPMRSLTLSAILIAVTEDAFQLPLPSYSRDSKRGKQ